VELTTPSNLQIQEATGWQVSSRTAIRKADLSIVERVHFQPDEDSSSHAILKTTCSALDHESHAYALLEEFRICAASLIACGKQTAGNDAWLLLTDAGEDTEFEPSTAIVGQALEDLAQMHQRYLGQVDSLAGIPRRDPEWMSSSAKEITDGIRKLSHEHDLGLNETTLISFQRRVEGLSKQFGVHQLTLIHGDFDPGNLHILPTGVVSALDWGLCHVNTPLADLAHMVERFNDQEQIELVDRYLRCLGVDIGIHPANIVGWGSLVHRTFFVWWHSLIVANGWSRAEDYLSTIGSRVEAIASSTL
jgi:hypothetical protein